MANNSSLYIIAAPIGNPDDITIRALNTIRDEIEILYCEDTRQTGKILAYHSIKKPLRSLHAHSDDKKILSLIDEVKNNINVGYMTDAGTPGLSDPGNKIVFMARKEGINVIPIPGVSALTAIISVCGFPDKNIFFGGFLSKKPGRRVNELNRLKSNEGIIVIYESPHRIKKTLKDIESVFHGKEIIIGREMTKKFEQFISFNSHDTDSVMAELTEKGEFAIGIFNRDAKSVNEPEDDQ